MGNLIRNKVFDVVSTYMYGEPIPTDASFESLGMDSLDVAGIVLETEDQFGVRISESEAAALHTVQDLVELVQKKKETSE